MNVVLDVLFLLLALFSTLRAVTASSTERLLWGSLLASVSLGLAVQLRGGSYYGVLMVAIFVVTDLMLYLFFRSMRLLPDRPPQSGQRDRVYRVFFLWLSLCAMAGILLLAFAPVGAVIWQSPGVSAVGLLYGRIWGGDWILIALPVLGMVTLVTGGFFLVRRDS